MKKLFILLLMSLSFLTIDIHSQIYYPPQLQKKIALVIGNGNYISSILANPENDAKAMENVLKKLGFVVYTYVNLDQNQMKIAIDEFGAKLKYNEVGLFYYAGHGIQSNGYNYLIPVDAQLKTEEQVEYDCVQADRVLGLMEGSGTKVNIIILDACRNNPFERSWTRSASTKGLAFMNAPKGTLIAYATSPGNTASDGSGANGLYTSAILESILIPKITILQMFQQVRSIVSQKSYDKQTPWESTSLTGDFYFNPGDTFRTNSLDENQKVSLIEINTFNGIGYIIDTRDQQHYETVKIGDQIWMAENLKTTRFNDGTPIPQVLDKITWSRLETPAYCCYDNLDAYKITYGALYNWYAVNTGKLCPVNWHIPSDSEWNTLINRLGGIEKAGEYLKEPGTAHWRRPTSSAALSVGFTALPGGYRDDFGEFIKIGMEGYWWSSSESNDKTFKYRHLSFSEGSIQGIKFKNKPIGLSVRCIKDK